DARARSNEGTTKDDGTEEPRPVDARERARRKAARRVVEVEALTLGDDGARDEAGVGVEAAEAAARPRAELERRAGARPARAPTPSGGRRTWRRCSTSAALGQVVALWTTTRKGPPAPAPTLAARASSASSITERASGRLGERAAREAPQVLAEIGARARDVAQ